MARQSAKLMPAPLAVDWHEVKTLSLAIGVREAARQMAISEEAVRKRCSREAWLEVRHEAKEKLANSTQSKAELIATAHNKPLSAVSANVSASDVLVRLGPDSKSKLAIAGNRAVTRLSEMDGDELTQPDVANTAHTWAKTLAIGHGWGADRNGAGAVSLNFLGDAQVVVAQHLPVSTDDLVQ